MMASDVLLKALCPYGTVIPPQPINFPVERDDTVGFGKPRFYQMRCKI